MPRTAAAPQRHGEALPPRQAHETRRRERTRERLLDAAYEVFAEAGVSAASVEQIAERAGFTRGAFYSNFSTKEELFFALMEREHELRRRSLLERVDALLPDLQGAAGTPAAETDEEQVGDLVARFLDVPFDNRRWCLVHSEFQLLAMRDPTVSGRFLAYREEAAASLVPILREAMRRAGRTFAVEPATTVRLLVSLHEDGMRASILAGRNDDEAKADARIPLARLLMAATKPL